MDSGGESDRDKHVPEFEVPPVREPEGTGNAGSPGNVVDSVYGNAAQASAIYGGVHFYADPPPGGGQPEVPFAVTPPPPFVNRERLTGKVLTRIKGSRDFALYYMFFGEYGSGRKSVARQVVHLCREEHPERFRGGYFEVEPKRDKPDELLGKLLALCYPKGYGPADIPTSPEGKRRRLRELLQRRDPFILVVDDADSLAQLQPLIPRVPGSVLLVTCTLPFDLDAGHGRTAAEEVGAEPVDEELFAHLDIDAAKVTPMSTEDAVELLSRRANCEFSPKHRELARQVVRATGGQPGALMRLARQLQQAEWSDDTEPGIVALHRRLVGPDSGRGTEVSEREAVLGELPDRARELCAKLALHPDAPFGVELAARLLGTDREDAEARLGILVDAALLEITGGEEEHARYRFADRRTMETLRIAPLGEPGLRADLIGTVLDYYLDLAWAAHAVLLPGRWLHPAQDGDPSLEPKHGVAFENSIAAYRRLHQEDSALRASIGFAVAEGRGRAAFRLCEALWAYWFLRGDFDAIVSTHTVLLDDVRVCDRLLPGELSRIHVQRSIATQRDDHFDDVRTSAESRAAHLGKARADAERAVELAREALPGQRPLALLTALEAVGDVHLAMAEHTQAAVCFAQSLGIAEVLDPPDSRAVLNAARKLGLAQLRDGRLEEARVLLDRAFSLLEWERQPDSLGEVVKLAVPREGLAGPSAPHKKVRRDGAGSAKWVARDTQNAAQVLAAQAEYAHRTGSLGEACRLWGEAIDYHAKGSNWLRMADVHVQRADAIEHTDPDAARADLEGALALYRRVSAGLAAEEVAARLQRWGGGEA